MVGKLVLALALAVGASAQITSYPPAGGGGGSTTVDGDTIKGALSCIPASGSGTTYTCALTTSVTLADQQIYLFKPDANNTGNAKINIDSQGAVAYQHANGDEWAAGDITAGNTHLIIYDADNTRFVPLGEYLSTNPGKLTIKCGMAPATPASGYVFSYCDDSNVPSAKDEAGTVYKPRTDAEMSSKLNVTTLQAGTPLYCSDASASGTTLTCTMTPTLTAYTAGMTVAFKKSSTACTGDTATTLNIDSLGAKSIKQADGSTDPASGDCPANRQLTLRYDGTLFRIVGGGASSAGGGTVTDSSYRWTYLGSYINSISSFASGVHATPSCCELQSPNGTSIGSALHHGIMLQRNSASYITLTTTIPVGWDGTISVKSEWFLGGTSFSGTAVHSYAIACETPGTSTTYDGFPTFNTASTVNTSVSGTYYTFVDTVAPALPSCAAGDDLTVKILRTDNAIAVDGGVLKIGISLPHTL